MNFGQPCGIACQLKRVRVQFKKHAELAAILMGKSVFPEMPN